MIESIVVTDENRNWGEAARQHAPDGLKDPVSVSVVVDVNDQYTAAITYNDEMDDIPDLGEILVVEDFLACVGDFMDDGNGRIRDALLILRHKTGDPAVYETGTAPDKREGYFLHYASTPKKDYIGWDLISGYVPWARQREKIIALKEQREQLHEP